MWARQPTPLAPATRGTGASGSATWSSAMPGTDKPAVDRFTLDVRPGETVALIGHSGSGKTTVTNLVLRTLAPTPARSRSTAIPWRK